MRFSTVTKIEKHSNMPNALIHERRHLTSKSDFHKTYFMNSPPSASALLIDDDVLSTRIYVYEEVTPKQKVRKKR